MTHLGERPDYGQGALPFSAIPPALWVRPLGYRLIRSEELALFTGVRGIRILGSSLAGSWIRPRNTSRITSPDTPHSPAPAELVTPMDEYAELWIPQLFLMYNLRNTGGGVHKRDGPGLCGRQLALRVPRAVGHGGAVQVGVLPL
jgi:hypothetical protein